MSAFLKIENIGVCPPEGFTVMGISLADTSNNEGVIGQFGSGNKHAVAVCLRNELSPIVFAGTLKMEFATKPQTVTDGLATKDFGRVTVKYGGTDPITKAGRSGTEDLGFVLEYGKQDWQDVALALREFISNAIDRAIRENGDWSGVKVEVVTESQVRAKKNCTRVFVPMNAAVLEFYNQIGKWFLHFSEPESLGKAILPKANRNLGDRKAAVIYRRGVRVREFESTETESLFDYNLNELRIDEARKASDWDVKHHCGKALANADKHCLARFFERLLTTAEPTWEFSFDNYSLQPDYRDSTVRELDKRKNWQEAFLQVAGEHGVLTGKGTVQQLQRKGYKPIEAPETIVNAAEKYGVHTPSHVLSLDEMSGRQVTGPTPNAQAAVDLAWGLLERAGLTNGKTKPPVMCFASIMDGGTMLQGYYRDGTVYINSDLSGSAPVAAGYEALSHHLVHVALEEVAHFVTGATDNSRDFQNFLLDLAVKLGREESCRRQVA